MSCPCCNKERDRPQHTYQSACCCRCCCCCCYSCCWCVNGPLLQCTQTGLRVRPSGRRRDGEERARVVVRGGGEAKEEKKEKERGIARRMEVRLPADAVDLCSIQCVMAASSWSSQSQCSCHRRIHPLQVMRSTRDQQRESLNPERCVLWHAVFCKKKIITE